MVFAVLHSRLLREALSQHIAFGGSRGHMLSLGDFALRATFMLIILEMCARVSAPVVA